MSGPVRLLAGDGHVRVGAATFPGGPLPDGRVGLLGVALRRLALAERDQLVALAEDDPRALGRLVGGAASDTELPDDDQAVAAIEAVALDLAGASHDGPLARTRVLTARAVGPGADGLAATDADDLAAELARAVEQDDGWTRIPLGDLWDDESGEPSEVRDRLARALLDRARQPLDVTLVRRLLVEGVGPEPQSPVAVGLPLPRPAATAPTTRPWTAPSVEHGQSGGPTTTPPASWVRAGGTATATASDRAAPDPEALTTGSPGTPGVSGASGASGATGAAGPLGPAGIGGDWPHPSAAQRLGTGVQQVSAPTPGALAGPWAAATPSAPTVGSPWVASDRWGAPVAVGARPSAPTGPDARSPWSTAPPLAATTAPAWSPSSSLDALAATTGPASGAQPAAVAGRVAPAAVAARGSVDDVALALHRAADLRGVRR
ncbi:hypothetical protein [Cellulomonas xylanilytica]|uniref:Uncharacterized protein n=1 Tax=Cellulomonas xylanilytica TaxID=233583 RepID=A0A510V2D6_9CELL|nr:hypothetical protein [Cellulomonas xylanilytica]GEK21057.1 hypothetical protein CXY01_15770 [Cellulomonas xylanilytica]